MCIVLLCIVTWPGPELSQAISSKPFVRFRSLGIFARPFWGIPESYTVMYENEKQMKTGKNKKKFTIKY